MPSDHVLVRTTPEFDQLSLPAGLLAAHRTAPGVWGRLVVRSGHVSFSFDDEPGATRVIAAGESIGIPPERPHRVVLTGPVRLVVEFYRPGGDAADDIDTPVETTPV